MRFKKKLMLGLTGSRFSSAALLLSIVILSSAVFFSGYLYQVYESFYDHAVRADGYSMGIESENGIPDTMLEKIMELDEAAGYNNAAMQTVRCMPDDFVNAAYGQGEKQVISSLPETEEVTLCGNLDTKWNRMFVNGNLKLVEGSWPEKGTSQVLLDENLCRKNGLQTGDSITVFGEDGETEYQLFISGIYSALQAPCETVHVNGEACELETGSSYIFCDADIWERISGHSVSDQLIDVYTDSERNLTPLLEKAGRILGPEYTIYDNVENRIQDNYTMIYTLKLFSNGSFVLIGVLSLVILGLQVIYWMQGQYSDAGIYLALGMRERDVKGLLIAKIMVISGAALTVSTVFSLILEHYGGDKLREIIFSFPMIPDLERYSADLFRVESSLWIVKNNLFYMLFFIALTDVVIHFLFRNSVKKLLK